MALLVLILLILNNCLILLLGLESSKEVLLEIKSSSIVAGHNLGFYKVDDTLNLTCIFKSKSNLHDVSLEWVVPGKSLQNTNLNIWKANPNHVVLVIENLQENDSGVYKCRAVQNGIPFFNSETSVKISVKNKKKKCAEMMFQCSPGLCILKRYTCDGHVDCPHGEDESPVYCGPGNPCEKKLMCPENRCIPLTWCCESNGKPNCTTKIKHSCCSHIEKLAQDVENDLGRRFEQQRINEMGFLQTTIYTVIGCAMAFMFIVTIIIVAICRVHVRRTLQSRNSVLDRNSALGRLRSFQGNRSNQFSLYDWDLYIRGAGLNEHDLMSINPLLVAYNTNDGIRFVGRPIDPPPYCEIVTSPPKEGPPPPYASRENLGDHQDRKAGTGAGTSENAGNASGPEIAEAVAENDAGEDHPDIAESESFLEESCRRQNPSGGSKSPPEPGHVHPGASSLHARVPSESQKLVREESENQSSDAMKRTVPRDILDTGLSEKSENISSGSDSLLHRKISIKFK